MNLKNCEAIQRALVAVGHKILIRFYECPAGEVMLITKSSGTAPRLCFWFDAKNAPSADKVTAYYLKRYGITDVKTQINIVY